MVAEASRVGIEVDMNNDAGWNGSGGPWMKPEHAMQKVVWTETAVEGQFDGSVPKPQQWRLLSRHRGAGLSNAAGRCRSEDAVSYRSYRGQDGLGPRDGDAAGTVPSGGGRAIVAGDAVVDLTAKLDKQGHLAWNAPAGKWTVLRIGHTLTGVLNEPSPMSGKGLECDKLSREAFDEHWAGLMGKIIADVGPEAGKTLNLHAHRQLGERLAELDAEDAARNSKSDAATICCGGCR